MTRTMRSSVAFCNNMLAEAATAEVGSLANVTPEQLTAFEQMLDAIVKGMGGAPSGPP